MQPLAAAPGNFAILRVLLPSAEASTAAEHAMLMTSLLSRCRVGGEAAWQQPDPLTGKCVGVLENAHHMTSERKTNSIFVYIYI